MSSLLNRRLRFTLALATVMVVGLDANAGGGQLMGAPGVPGTLTPSDVLANPESFLGTQIQVRGRIHLESYETAAGPCNPATGEGCISPAFTSLHVVTAGEPRRDTNVLDLHRPTNQGGEEPLRCRVVGPYQFDCGTYTQDAVVIVSGRLVKHRIPTQQVVYPDGRVEVFLYREIYVLLVQP